MGLSTSEGVRFQGWHGKILIVIDEAPGVKPEIYEAIEGIRAGGDVRLLAHGNPTISSGPFYDAYMVRSRVTPGRREVAEIAGRIHVQGGFRKGERMRTCLFAAIAGLLPSYSQSGASLPFHIPEEK